MAKAPTIETVSATDTYELIFPGFIVPDPENVRDDVGDITDLANSIYQNGLQQPLRVRLEATGYVPGDDAAATYVIIAGHRRFAAIRWLIEQGLWDGDVPCMVAPEGTSKQDITAAMIVENLQRADLNPVEEAKAFDRLTKEFRYKRADLALKIGRSESYVGDRLALIKLPEEIQASISVGYYPLTSALLLKGVAHDVVLDVTKGGRVIAGEHEIRRAVQQAEYTALKAALIKAATESGIAVALEERFVVLNNSEEIATFATLDDAKLLAKYEGAPRNAKLVYNDSPYSGSFSVILVKPLTEKQLEARRNKQQEAWTAEQREREAQRQARYEAERASWTDEYRAWVDEVDRIKAEHIAASEERERVEEAHAVAWSAALNAKDVSAWLFHDLIDRTPHWEMYETATRLGYEGSRSQAEISEWVTAFIQGSAKQLVQFAAMLLADTEVRNAVDSLEFYLTACNIPDVPEPVLPPEPANSKETTDDPLDDVA